MSFTIADVKTRMESKAHGTSLNKLADVYGLIYEAAGNLLLRVNPQETKRTAQITNALYDQVYEYIAPTDLKSDAIIDVFPQVNRNASDNFSQNYAEDFDLYKSNNTLTTQFNSGVKTPRISKSLTSGVLLNGCDSLTANGTWSAGGNATNLAVDTLNRVTGSGSLKFDISASGTTAYLENSTQTAVDWSSLVNAGAIFVWAYIPSITIITSVTLRWGSSSANYNSVSVTATQDNTAFVVGWNLLRFDWAGSTATGTLVSTAINYSRVTFNYSGTATTSCRIDSIIGKLGSIYNASYYSKYLFKTTGGTWIEKPTLDTDIVNLDVESYNLLNYEVDFLMAQELQGSDATFDTDFWQTKGDRVYADYMAQNKSEKMKKQVQYYRGYVRRRR